MEARGGDTHAIDSVMRLLMCGMRLPKFSAA
jgi:hypothetical protein